MEKTAPSGSLDDIRRAIDEIDGAMLELLERRFEAIEAVDLLKQRNSSQARCPVRPAREAQILRRLHALARGTVPFALVVRLWRSMIGAATLMQAATHIHIGQDIDANQELRDLVRDHFSGLSLRRASDAEAVMAQLSTKPQDIGVVSSQSPFVAALLGAGNDNLQVIGSLPFIGRRDRAPRLLILGQIKPEPSGDDETLVVLKSDAARPGESVLWRVEGKDYSCVALEGFLDGKSAEVVKLQTQGQPRPVVIGRFPRRLEASE